MDQVAKQDSCTLPIFRPPKTLTTSRIRYPGLNSSLLLSNVVPSFSPWLVEVSLVERLLLPQFYACGSNRCLFDFFRSPFSFSRSSLSGNAMAVELADSFISRAARVSFAFVLSGS